MGNEQRFKDQPIRSRSTAFFERYARAETENRRLVQAVLFLGALCAVFAGVLLVTAVRPRPVYYIPGAVTTGMAFPDRVPLSAVKSFATAWIMNWMNFTPETIDNVYTRAMKMMAPGLLSRVHAGAVAEQERVRQERISSIFVPDEDVSVTEDEKGFEAVFKGQRSLFVGKEEMTRESARLCLRLVRHPPTEEDPYGIAVNDIIKD